MYSLFENNKCIEYNEVIKDHEKRENVTSTSLSEKYLFRLHYNNDNVNDSFYEIYNPFHLPNFSLLHL